MVKWQNNVTILQFTILHLFCDNAFLPRMKYFILITCLLFSCVVEGQPGSLDMTFNRTGMVVIALGDTDNCGHSMAIQPDNKIIVVGSPYLALGNCFITVRLNEDGSMDRSFGINGVVATMLEPGANEEAYTTALQPDGKILAGGYSNGKFAMVRYMGNGTLDTSFGTGGIVLTAVGTNGKGSDIALQKDGKILMTGSGNNQFTTVRYLPDGTPDPSFGNSGFVGTSVGSLSSATAVAVQNDGKIVVAGNSLYNVALARYRTDGSLDSAFGLNGVVTTPMSFTMPPVPDVVIQEDGKILVAGGVYYHEVTLARYNTDGSPDLAFGHNGIAICPISSPASPSSLALQPDGKIVTSGYWSPSESILCYAMARLNFDGSLDIAFGDSGSVHTPIQGVHDVANAVRVRGDGKIFLAGCSHYTGSSNCDFAVARYNGGTAGISENEDLHGFYIYPNPAKDKIFIEIKNSVYHKTVSLSIYSIQGDLLIFHPLKTKRSEMSVRALPEGNYIIKFTSGLKSSGQKLVIKR